MILKSGSFDNMAQYVKQTEAKIFLFGAGVIGTVTVPEILHHYGLEPYVECYIDNEEKKWGKMHKNNYMEIPVFSPQYLNEHHENVIVLLNISRYSEVLDQLEQLKATEKLICYIIPMMLIYDMETKERIGAIKDYTYQQIPKKIHYMWLGKKEIPERLQKCIDSWKRFCPDYEIIQWNEDNYDLEKNTYMRQAYAAKAYGFVPDYARLDILYNYGGIYLDTDVELIRNLDDLLYEEAFCGVEKWQVVNFGGCSGSTKGNKMIKEFRDNRENLLFVNPDGSYNRTTCGYYDTKVLLNHGYRINGKVQKINGMNIYTSDYFHPYDYTSGMTQQTSNTFSIHHFDGGWLDEIMKKGNEQTAKKFNQLYELTKR